MKKLLIIALLFWGCDYAPTEHTHDHSHDEYVHTHEHEHDTTHEHDTEHTHDHNGVCIARHIGVNSLGEDRYSCYPNYTLKAYITEEAYENEYATEYEGHHHAYDWITDMTCEEFCAMPSDYECYIWDEYTENHDD